jgi:hypothetical protein
MDDDVARGHPVRLGRAAAMAVSLSGTSTRPSIAALASRTRDAIQVWGDWEAWGGVRPLLERCIDMPETHLDALQQASRQPIDILGAAAAPHKTHHLIVNTGEQAVRDAASRSAPLMGSTRLMEGVGAAERKEALALGRTRA